MLAQAIKLFQQQQFDAAHRLLLTMEQQGSRSADVYHLLGVICAMSGHLQEAVSYFGKAIQLAPNESVLHFNLAKAYAGLGLDAEALPFHLRAIQLDHANPDAWCNYGLSLLALKKYPEAVQALQRGHILAPQDAEIHLNLAVALFKNKNYENALSQCDEVLKVFQSANAWVVKANILQSLQRDTDSLICANKALKIQPEYEEALVIQGIALFRLGRYVDALQTFDSVLESNPGHVNALYHRAASLQMLGNESESDQLFQQVLKLDDKHEYATLYFAKKFSGLKNYDQALTLWEKLIEIDSKNPEYWIQKGLILLQQKKSVEALDHFDQAIRLDPQKASPWIQKGHLCADLGLLAESVDNFKCAFDLEPRADYVAGFLMDSRNKICDWANRDNLLNSITASIRDFDYSVDPFAALGYVEDVRAQFDLAELHVGKIKCTTHILLTSKVDSGKIKIGYFSPDFKNHAVAILTAELFELHDRSKFEVHAFSLENEVTPGHIRQRLINSFDHFHHVHDRSTNEIVELARSLSLDIAIDLAGFTKYGRPEIFIRRVAPVQVNYLGFPGTMGSINWDYIIADEAVIPPELHEHYAEQIIYLPHCFQVNDREREISDRTFSRAELGLPEKGFVYCCFSNTYKITPDRFELWMDILKAVPDSCLWLLAGHDLIEKNLRREAVSRNVDPSRLVFGKRLPAAEYLARYRIADLFLDTHPFNAGTTASDALWAGLPVLTAPGDAFASRMAASLVKSAGLSELVARDLTHYKQLAIELGQNPAAAEALKQKLRAQVSTCDLFNTPQTVRDLENAFEIAVNRSRLGVPPRTFGVTELDVKSGHDMKTCPKSPFERPQLIKETPFTSSKIFIHQIYYDEKTRHELDPLFTPLDNTENSRPDWFEFWPMLNFFQTHKLESDAWYGFFSPKFHSKTGLTGSFILDFINRLSPNIDLALFSPHGWVPQSYYLNSFEQGDFFHPGLLNIAQKFVDHHGWNCDLQSLVSNCQTSVYSNYVVARGRYWIKWFEIATQFWNAVETADDDHPLKQRTAYIGTTNVYPMKTFIQERFHDILINVGGFKSISPDFSRIMPIAGYVEDSTRNRKFLIECDFFKGEFLRTGDPKFLDQYRLIKSKIRTITHESNSK